MSRVRVDESIEIGKVLPEYKVSSVYMGVGALGIVVELVADATGEAEADFVVDAVMEAVTRTGK